MIMCSYLLLSLVFCEVVRAQNFFLSAGMFVGCFYDQQGTRDLPFSPTLSRVTVKTCTTACTSHYYAYAGLQGGDDCFCGGSYGRYGPGQCDTPCTQDNNNTCGGSAANSVYSTGFTGDYSSLLS